MKWDQNFSFPACKAGNDQKVVIRLFGTLTKPAFGCLQQDSAPQDPGSFLSDQLENRIFLTVH